MPSNWYSEFMKLNGFDVEDPYFDTKIKSYEPPELGIKFDSLKDQNDYFESGGEYDKAAGDATGLFGNVADFGLKVGGSALSGGLGLMGVAADAIGVSGNRAADLINENAESENRNKTDFEKFTTGLLGAPSGVSEVLRGVRKDINTATDEGMAFPVNDFTLADPLGNYKQGDSFVTATANTAKDIVASGADIGADMLGAAALGAGLPSIFGGAAAKGLPEVSSIGQKALAYGQDILASNVSKGFQASGFADMYEAHTQGKDDSRIEAAAIAAPYAVATGLLEGIGALETFGSRTLSKYLVGDSVKSWAGRRAAAGLLGGVSEGATEYPQQWLQIVAEELPGDSVNDADPLSAWQRITERSPEAWQAALGGALFGGPVGSFVGLGKVPKADARSIEVGGAVSGNPKTADEAIQDVANGIDTPVNIAQANLSSSLLDISEDKNQEDNSILGSAASVIDSSVAALESREKLEQQVRVEILGAASTENAIIQQATEEKRAEVVGGLVTSVESLVERDLAEFDNINLGWQNFMASATANQPQNLGKEASQFEDGNALAEVAHAAGFDPQIVAQATAARFEKIGVDPIVFTNGISQVDLDAVREQLKSELTQKYASKSLPVAEAIEKAVTPEDGSDTHSSIQTLKAMAGPKISDGDAYNQAIELSKQSPVLSATGLQEALKISKSRASALIKKLESDGVVGPQTHRGQPRQVLLTPEERSAPSDRPLSRQPEPVDTPKETIAKKLLSFINDKVRSSVSTDWREAMTKTASLGWLTKPYRLAAPGAPEVTDYHDVNWDTFQAIRGVSESVGKEGFIKVVTDKIKSDTRVSKKFHQTFTDPFVSRMADLREKHDALSAAVRLKTISGGKLWGLESNAEKGAKAEVALAEVKKEMATEVRKYRRQLVRQNIPPGLARSVYDVNMAQLDYYMEMYDSTRDFDGKKDRESARAGAARSVFLAGSTMKSDPNQSIESAPSAKIVSMWLYTNANSDLSKRVIAKMVGQEYSIEEENKLANDLASDLLEDGLFESLIEEDDFTKRAFLNNIVEQGKSVSSPHGLYIALTSAGEDPAVAISMVAGLHAASVNAQERTGVSMTAFWDRLADHIMTAKDAFESEVPHGMFSPGGAKETDKYSGHRVSAFSKMAINVLGGVHEGVKNSYSIVMQHELMHALHRSGLLMDVIGPDGIKAIEKITGDLYYPNGKAIWDEKTAERLAVAWEIFLATNNAPSPQVWLVFGAAKNFFKTYLNSLYNMVERVFHAKMWNVKGPSGNPMRYRETDASWVQYSVLEKQLNANKDAIKALYRLVYAEPTSEAHMATGGLVGVSGALVSEMSDISGVDMSGVMAKTAKMDGPFERRPEGWTPESGKPISRQQLSDTLGFQGMNPDDPLVIEALDGHERNVGVRLGNWADDKPMERRSSPVMQSGIDKKKQKAAEALLKSGASLRGSQTATDWLQEVSDTLISDGKMSPLYNNEEIDFSSVDGVKTLLTEWPRLTRRFIDYAKSNGTMAAINKALPYIGKAHLRSIVTQWTSMEKNFANVLAPIEAAVENLGLPNVAMHVNNMFSLSRWAGDITERVPMYFDEELEDWVIIPGSESWRNITNDLIAWQDAYFKTHGKTLSTKTMQQFSIKSQRDLRLWMLAQREIEVFEHSQKVVKEHMDAVAEWEQKVRDGKTTEPKPAKPKIPKLSEAAISLAKNVKMVLEMTYGEDIKTLDMLSLRYSKWESDSKLVPLLKSKLITPKMYADMMSAGLRHVPFSRVVEMVEQSGAVDVNIDGSMYQVLDYLKQDLTFKVQDPMLAAIKSVQSVNILTQRQIAKNAIGRAVSESVPVGTSNGSFVALHSKKKISKEEFDKLPEEQREEKQDKESAKQYYQIVPATKDDIGAILAQLRHRIQGLHGKKREEAEVLMNGGIFASYLEPGNPIYIRILDAEVAQSFYMMNNPQVLYATNAVAKWFGRTQQWFKGQYVTSPQFVFNQLFRDIPNALIRSKHGMRLSDIANGIVTSLNMSGFDEISQIFDKSGESGSVSADALKGFGPFGGLVSSVGPGGNMDVNLLIAASHDSGSTKNSKRLIHSHIKYYENMKKHGAVFPSLKQVSEAFKAGDWSNVKDNALLLPKLLFSLPRAFMSVPASVLENAPRLAERRLMMDVDMMKYPELMKRFPGRYKIDANGKALAGYAGTLHRREWEAAEKRLQGDPNAIVPVGSLPIQYASMEKDFDTRGITLPFDQKGKWTPKIDIAHIFFGPAMLDMYTSIKKIGDNSITQGVLDKIRTADEIAKRKSKLHYNTTSVLGQEFKYTDQDGMALAMAIKAVAAITIPAIAQAAYYWDDDEWQAQSMTEKLGYYHIPTPWGKRLRIARGLGFMQLLFSDLPTAAMLAYGEKDPRSMKKWASRFLQSTPIGAIAAAPMAFAEGKGGREAALQGLSEWTPEIVKGTSEALLTDYDSYRDKQVSFETGFTPEDPTRVKSERYNILANTIARIEGVQPAQARHQVKSLFPGTKAMIPWLANYGMEAAAGATTGMPDNVEASNAPIYGQGTGGVIRPFSRSPFGVGNEFVQAIYKLDRSLTGYYNSSEKMSETTKAVYLSQHPELQYRDIVREAVDSINSDQDMVMELRKEGLANGDNGLTEYDLNKKMTMQAMETYRLFYGKLLGQ